MFVTCEIVFKNQWKFPHIKRIFDRKHNLFKKHNTICLQMYSIYIVIGNCSNAPIFHTDIVSWPSFRQVLSERLNLFVSFTKWAAVCDAMPFWHFKNHQNQPSLPLNWIFIFFVIVLAATLISASYFHATWPLLCLYIHHSII